MIVFAGCLALVIFPASQAPHKVILEEFDILNANDMLLLRKRVQILLGNVAQIQQFSTQHQDQYME